MSTTINYDTALKRLAASHDSIAKEIENVIEYWKPALPPSTIMMGNIGHTLSNNAEILSPSELALVFGLIEELMSHGDEYVRTGVATGLLEAILHHSSDNKLNFKTIAPYMGPESKAYCRAYDRFTGCITPGLEE